MIMDLALTPTQKRLMEILKDGQPHPVAQLWACLGDEQSVGTNLNVHIFHLKARLEVGGLTIATARSGQVTTFRLVRFLGDDDE